MATRSRQGCIDCKKAKVKCDEVHPSCGTCKRRRRQCSGYIRTARAPKACEARAGLPLPTITATHTASNGPGTQSLIAKLDTNEAASPSAPAFSPLARGTFTLADLSTSAGAVAQILGPRLLKSVAAIPSGTIPPADEPFIEVYFMRHPVELVFGPEFVDEMNSSVLQVFQRSPLAVSDSLCAIGEAYLRGSTNTALVPVQNRKLRILARLRKIDSPGVDLELLLILMLGLCAVELVDAKQHVTNLPVLLDNLAMMLDRHICEELKITQLAKYFIRALARQDMMVSLTRFHRPRISTSYWLDEYSSQHADRFMGYTCTLMPLLSELCALAEDLGATSPSDDCTDGTVPDSPFPKPFHDPINIFNRANHLRSELHLWHPTIDPTLSFQSSRKFLMHANAYRSCSLLYLYRLLQPPGSSEEADQTALIMAYEVMAHTSTCDDDLKMSLWPIFLASCEVSSEADRVTAAQMLGSICNARKTATATRTKSFVVNRVWSARDSGLDWNWMILCLQHPDELLPI